MAQSNNGGIDDLDYAAFASVIAPNGVLSASINTGNAVLAAVNAETNEPEGLSVDIARHLARKLGVEERWLVTDRAADAVAVVSEGRCDLGFFAVDPARADYIAFSDPYLLIEGSYLVKDESLIRRNEDVDVGGNVILVSKGSAYDHFLTRNVKHAELDRSAGPKTIVETFLKLRTSVAAGIRAQFEDAIGTHTGLRLLDGRFMEIPQALGIPKTKGADAAAFMARFAQAIMRDGTLETLYAKHRIKGAVIAPLVGAL